MKAYIKALLTIVADAVGPIHPKVVASTLTALVVSVLTTYVVKGGDPTTLEAVVLPLVTAGVTGAAGWLAKHEPKS